MTMTTMPAEIAEDLRLHGIDPATAEYRDTRTRMGNGGYEVRLPGTPARVATTGPERRSWGLMISGRYVRDGEWPREYPSAGAALSWEG